MRFYIAAAFMACLLAIGSGCSGGGHESDNDTLDTIPTPEVSDFLEEITNSADSAILAMSRERKAAQLFMPAIYASDDSYTLRKVKEYAESGICGLILLKGDAKSAATIADSMARWSEIPPFIAIDAEWGLAMRLKDAPKFPINSRIADDTDEGMMYEYGYEVARECRLLGINMVLGPVLDITSEGSYIGRRSLGTDPERVSSLSIAYARGLEAGNVMSVAKHFPGHGAAKGNSHLRKLSIEKSLQSLDSIDLQPFRKYIEQQLSGIMIGHLAFPAIDPDMLPAAVSPTIINDLLRTDLQFQGIVLTDAMNMLGAEGYGADKAIGAGADIVLAPADTGREISNVLSGMEKGEITETEIDTHLRRILQKKYALAYDYTPMKRDSLSLPEDLESTRTKAIQVSLDPNMSKSHRQ